jgi:hypothetical protein
MRPMREKEAEVAIAVPFVVSRDVAEALAR